MTREEKEEAYNKARERIFGTASTDVSTPGMSLACPAADAELTTQQRTRIAPACQEQVLFPFVTRTIVARRQGDDATRILLRLGPTMLLTHQRMDPLISQPGFSHNTFQQTPNSMSRFRSSSIRVLCHLFMPLRTRHTLRWRLEVGTVYSTTTGQMLVYH